MNLTAVIFLCLLTVHKNGEKKHKNLRNIGSVIILKYFAVFYLFPKREGEERGTLGQSLTAVYREPSCHKEYVRNYLI